MYLSRRKWPPTSLSRRELPPRPIHLQRVATNSFIWETMATFLFILKERIYISISLERDCRLYQFGAEAILTPFKKMIYPPTRLSKRRWPPTHLSRRMWPPLPTCLGEGGHQFDYQKNSSHLIIFVENIYVHIFPCNYPGGNGHPLFGSGGNGYPYPFI